MASELRVDTNHFNDVNFFNPKQLMILTLYGESSSGAMERSLITKNKLGFVGGTHS